MVDYRRCGMSARMSPEDPRCYVLTGMGTQIELGGAGNVAYWLAAQHDLQVTLFCHWTYDKAGFDLKKLCRQSGIELSDLCLRHDGYQTTQKERICIEGTDPSTFRQLVRCDQDANGNLSETEFKLIRHALRHDHFDLIVVADYQKGMFTGLDGTMLRDWLAVEGPVIVNSKVPRGWEHLFLTALICNRDEASTSWPRRVSQSLYGLARAHRLVITQGAEGAACNLLEDTDSIYGTIGNMPSLADHVIDVTGAGDAFTAGFAAHYLRRPQMAAHASLTDSEVKACIHEGQRWAAHCCRQIGCGQPLVTSAPAAHDDTENTADALPA